MNVPGCAGADRNDVSAMQIEKETRAALAAEGASSLVRRRIPFKVIVADHFEVRPRGG